MNKEVPAVLVKTWIDLVRSDDTDQKVKTHALLMLKNAFGSHENIAIYMKKHKLK